MSYLIKNLHFIVIHVPIAMLLFSFVFDLLALVLKKKEWHSAGWLCLLVGTLGAIAAVITGPDEDRNPLKPTHEMYGQITMVLFIVLTVIRLGLLWLRKKEIGGNLVYLAAALVGVVLVAYTGHLGGKMVHPDRSNFQQFRGGNGNFPQGEGGGQRQSRQNRQGQQQQQQQPQTQSGASAASQS